MVSGKAKNFLRYAALVLGSFCLAVIIAEIYLSSRASSRLTLPFYNRLYPYVVFRPHENATYISAETHEMSRHTSQVFHYTNEDGFRVRSSDYALARKKPEGEMRIAVLGGSAVQLGSTFETTLPGSLEAVLREKQPGADIEVINAGIQSSVSRQSIAHLIFTVVEYSPDVVILYDGANDVGMPLAYDARPNFPYNFWVIEEAWESYRREQQEPLYQLVLNRSHLYQSLRARFTDAEATQTRAPGVDAGLQLGPRAVPAKELLQERELIRDHIAAYLSNWKKLIELSFVYHYRPVCVLQPTGGLEPDYALSLYTENFDLDEETAEDWIAAFSVLYEEARGQIQSLREAHPEAVILDLSDSLQPGEHHFWDGVHVYDETNRLIAERIYREIEPQVRESLSR